MLIKNPFPATLLGAVFLAGTLINAPQSHAKMQTFQKEYTYTASELDSKSSCRAIALEQVKRLLLQELGVYVESVFSDKASSEGKTKDEVRREITTLSAGVASTEVVAEKWDGQTYWLKARIKADPDDVAKKIDALRQDKQKSADLEDVRNKAAELTAELERMRKELDDTRDAAAKAEEARRYNEAILQLRAAEWYNKGYAFSEAKQYEKAVEAYSEAIGLDPKYAIAYFMRGDAYDYLGNYQRAIEDYSTVIGMDPQSATNYFMRAISYGNLKDFQRAIEDFNMSITLNPKDAASYSGRARAYGNLGDHQRAIGDYSKAMKLEPKDPTNYFMRGAAYGNLGDHKHAIEDYSKAIELDPSGGSAYYMRAITYGKLGDTQRAIEDHKTAAGLGDEYSRNYLNSQGIPMPGEADDKDDDRRDVEKYSKAIELDPKDPMNYYMRGTAYDNLGDDRRAVADYGMAIELDPKDPMNYFMRGSVYDDLGDYKHAIEDYSKALKLDPKDGSTYYMRAVTYGKLGDTRRAIDDHITGARLGNEYSQKYLTSQGIPW